jgi:hypothetical protein
LAAILLGHDTALLGRHTLLLGERAAKLAALTCDVASGATTVHASAHLTGRCDGRSCACAGAAAAATAALTLRECWYGCGNSNDCHSGHQNIPSHR